MPETVLATPFTVGQAERSNPLLGTWPEPWYGDLGVLADDGDKVQCHICGGWFHHLGNHVVRGHGLSAGDYTTLFGLNASTGLISSSLAAKRRTHLRTPAGQASTAKMNAAGRRYVEQETPEQRRARMGHFESLESRIKRDNVESRRRGHVKGVRRRREMHEAGELRLARHTQDRVFLAEMGRRGRKAAAELREDPEYKRAWAEKISMARGGPSAWRCVICGRENAPHSAPYKAKVCSDACLRELRRRAAREAQVARRPEVRRKMAAAARRKRLVRDDLGRIVAVNPTDAVER